MKKVRVEASTKKDRSCEIFGNPMSKKVIRKAQKSKQKNQKKYGDDSKVNYQCIIRDNPCIGEPLGVKNVVVTRKEGKGSFDEEKCRRTCDQTKRACLLSDSEALYQKSRRT